MEPTVLVVGVLGLVALAAKFVDFLRYLTNLPSTRSSVVTQLGGWAAGIAAVFLYAASQFGSTAIVNGLSVDRMNFWTKVLVGLAVGSLASKAKDFVKALDNTDSAAVPPLLPSAAPPVPPTAAPPPSLP